MEQPIAPDHRQQFLFQRAMEDWVPADHPATGRVDGEDDYQIGFVDIAHTPYAETIEASREVGRQNYLQRLGEVPASLPR